MATRWKSSKGTSRHGRRGSGYDGCASHEPGEACASAGCHVVSQFWQFVLLGLGTGAVYALTAQGIVLIYRGSGVLNLAQGALGMLGAFVYYKVGVEQGWS